MSNKKLQQKKLSDRKKRVEAKLLDKRAKLRAESRINYELGKIRKKSENVVSPIRNKYE